MKRIITEEKYIEIISVGAFYDNKSSDRAPSIIYLKEVYQKGKDYNAELQKAIKEWRANPSWTDYPKIVEYWETIEIKETF